MKNLVVLLMALALIGTVSAQCLTGPIWGLANSENPYTFSTDADPFSGTDCWNGWDGTDNTVGGSTSGGLLTIDRSVEGGYGILFNHDNALVDLGVTPGLDKIELVIIVDSISPGANAIVKIEQYPAGDASFPNPNNGLGAIVTDAWDPDTTITGPGYYSFITAAPADTDAVAVTPVIGVVNGSIVIDEIWIGPEECCGPPPKAYNPSPANNSLPASGSVTNLTWELPAVLAGHSVNLRFEKENATDGSGNYVYDPNWGAANGVATTMVTKSAIDKTSQAFIFGMAPYLSPLADGLYSWRVDIGDFGDGTVWLFEVGGDSPPEPNQPDNQYMYVSQTDGDGDPNIRTFVVEFDYTDDGNSPITAADVKNLNWGWDPDGVDNILGNADDERGVEMISAVYNPILPATTTSGTVTAVFQTHYDAVDPNYSTDIMGYWDIRLEVTDGSGTALGTAAHHEIWNLCGEAAIADPDDDFNTTYDVDLNCKTDLVDLADFLSRWLNQSTLYE